jgi:hypothetical protein
VTALALALLVALAPSAPTRPGPPGDTTATACPGGQTFSPDDLDAAGLDHVSDLLRFVDAVAAFSVDGFDATPLAGLRPGRGLRLLVDGAPAAANTTVEPVGVDGLPVSVSEIARVVYCPGPGVAGGRWGGPWLDVQTAAPALHGHAAAFFGNETGDPGPDRYLDPALPNVDHWGPDFEGALVVRSRPGSPGRLTPLRGPAEAWLSFRNRNLFPTDTAIAPRVFDAVVPGHYPARAFTTVALAARLPSARVRLGGAWGLDLPHVPEVGREVPASRRAFQATVAGEAVATERLVVRGHAHAATLGLDRPEWGALPLDPAWTETRVDVGADARLPRAGGALRFGVQADGTAASGPGLRDGSVGVGRVWAASEGRAGRAARSLTLAAAAAGSGAALSAGVSETRPVGPVDATLTLAAGRTLAEEAPDLAFWTARGYRGLAVAAGPGSPGVPFRIDRAPGALDDARVRLDAAARFGGVSTDASAEFVRSRGDAVLVRFAPDGVAVEPGEPGPGEARVVPAAGEALRAHVGAAGQAGPLALRVAVSAEGDVGGNGAFREVWARRPALRGVAEATVRPDARLSLRVRLDARTGTTWAGYPRPDVPAAALVDVALVRRFWGDRVRAQLVGRNVLGAPERTHPLGATLAPRLFVRLDARF